MKKLVLVTSEFPPQPGGIGSHALGLAKGFQKQGFEVSVMCDIRSRMGDEEQRFDKKLSFRVLRVQRRKMIWISYLERIIIAFKLIKAADVIIASGKFYLWLGAFLKIFFKKKFIAVIHGSEVKLPNQFLRKLTDKSLMQFDKIIAVSNYTKSLVSHLPLKDIVVIPNGFEVCVEPKKQKRNEPTPILITVGNVTQRKGQQNVIQALPTLIKKYPKLKYHIVGIPTDKNSLEKLALQLGVNDAVIFFGKVSEAEKNRLLSESDIFVMLSETTQTGDVEGFGIAILEANALGVPAIGAKGCGIEEAIKDGISGRLISNKNIEQLEMAIETILNNYQIYIEGAINWSVNFTWDEIILKYIAEVNTEK